MSKSMQTSKADHTLDADRVQPLVCYDESDALKQDRQSQNTYQDGAHNNPACATSVKEISSDAHIITIFLDEPLELTKPTNDKKGSCQRHQDSWLYYPIFRYCPARKQHLPSYFDQREQFNINNLMFLIL